MRNAERFGIGTSVTILKVQTSPKWLPLALANFDALLIDHAHCEKKAAANALSLLNAYPEDTELVRRMAGLAGEEIRHFRQVLKLLVDRGQVLSRDQGDPYAQALAKCVRTPKEARKLDRLLIASLIEARSSERLALLGEGLSPSSTQLFYARLARTESGHHRLFLRLAEREFTKAVTRARLEELALLEAQWVRKLPIEARMH